jgi:hypothetical protein
MDGGDDAPHACLQEGGVAGRRLSMVGAGLQRHDTRGAPGIVTRLQGGHLGMGATELGVKTLGDRGAVPQQDRPH